MRNFGDFGIVHEAKDFTGPKISIQSVLNLNIVVEKYRIGPSNIPGKSDRLDLQLLVDGVQRITWVSSKNLISMIRQIPDKEFPFTAKITAIEGGGFKFIPADKNFNPV